MQTKLQSVFSLVGRLLLAFVFVPAGLSKISGFAGTVGYITSVGMPLPSVSAVVAILVEVGCGIALLAGFQTRIAALILAAFTLVASFFFHNFWTLPEAQQMMQQLMFFKNIGIVGGLLTLAAWGAGALSVDAKFAK
ncbi:MAG: DoxX family protein [Burkholderiaceae bacterium]